MTRTMKGLLILVLLTLCTSAIIQAKQRVIWYLPHPDDETIAMADSIYQSVTQGNHNYFIYFTKGENSWARHRLKGPDGTSYQLTKEEFGVARVRETMAALEVLGVRADQILFMDFPDGGIPQDSVEKVIRTFAQLYPGSIHRTVSEMDLHEDHQTLARALAQVSAEEGMDIFPEYYHVYVYRGSVDQEKLTKRLVEHPSIKAQALAEFYRWDPENGRYAIAAASTPDLLTGAMDSIYEFLDTPHETVKQKLSFNPGVIFSTSELGVTLEVGNKLTAQALLDYKDSASLGEITWRLSDDIPLAQLIVGVGYHFQENRPYTSTIMEVGNNYYLKIRHTWRGTTNLSIGITANLIKH